MFVPELINDISETGLSEDLIHCLHVIAIYVPEEQDNIENRLLQELSINLAGSAMAYAMSDRDILSRFMAKPKEAAEAAQKPSVVAQHQDSHSWKRSKRFCRSP